MSDTNARKTNKFLLFLVGLLLVAVGVQAGLMYRMRHEQEARARVVVDAEDPAPLSAPARPDARSWSPWFGADPLDPWQGMDEWDPFAEMQRMQERMNRLFEDSFSRFQGSPGFADGWGDIRFAPSLDLRDDGDAYVVRMDIPGAEKSNIEVHIEDRVLTVSGETDETVEETDGNQVLRQERRRGQFQRAVTLPGPVKAEEMHAAYENGVLTVRIPKGEEPPRARRVNVL